MSMGRKMTAALLALKAEDRLPPGIRTIELEQLLYDKLKDHGHHGNALPDRRTFYRHLDRLRALLQPADVTICHSKPAAADGIVAAETEQEGQRDDGSASAS